MPVAAEKVSRKAAKELLLKGQEFLAKRIEKLDAGMAVEEVLGGTNAEALGVNIACDESCKER